MGAESATIKAWPGCPTALWRPSPRPAAGQDRRLRHLLRRRADRPPAPTTGAALAIECPSGGLRPISVEREEDAGDLRLRDAAEVRRLDALARADRQGTQGFLHAGGGALGAPRPGA